jgi:hypothetical protein
MFIKISQSEYIEQTGYNFLSPEIKEIFKKSSDPFKVDEYEMNNGSNTGRVIRNQGNFFIIPDKNYYSNLQLKQKYEEDQLNGTGQRELPMEDFNVIVGKLSKTLEYIDVEVVESNCEYLLVVFLQKKDDIQFIFNEVIDGITLFGSKIVVNKSKYGSLFGVFDSNKSFMAGTTTSIQNIFHKSNDDETTDFTLEGRFLCIMCPYYKSNIPNINLNIHISRKYEKVYKPPDVEIKQNEVNSNEQMDKEKIKNYVQGWDNYFQGNDENEQFTKELGDLHINQEGDKIEPIIDKEQNLKIFEQETEYKIGKVIIFYLI